MLTLKVPMELLNTEGSIEFNMVYHVESGVFEKVEMLNSETREVHGNAEFTLT